MSLDSEVRKRSDMMEETGPDPDPVMTSSGSTIKTTTTTCKNNRKWLLLNTHLNAVIYSSCFWVQIGVLPYLSKKLGADPVVFGYLQTTFAVVQLCGGPIFGRFGDIFGSRAALVLSFMAAAMSYTILGLASTVSMLFLSRLPSIFMHAMQGSQMVVTDISEKEGRADALGKLGVSYAIGMVIGPFVGGLITKKYGEQSAAFFAATFSFISIIISLLFIPRNTKALSPQEKSAEKLEANNKEQPASVFSIKKILELLHIPTVLYLITIKIITGIPFGIFQSMFSLVSMEFFKLEPQQNGFVMSYVGVLSIVAQGLIVGVLSRRFSEPFLLRGAICVIASAYGLLYMVTDIYQFCIVIIPMVVGGTTLNVITTSAMTKSVTVTKTGAVLGLSMATNSLIRTVSPTMGSIMYKNYGWPSIGLLGLVVNAAVALFLFYHGKDSF